MDESKCAYERDRLTRMEVRLDAFTDPENGMYKRIRELDKRINTLERVHWAGVGIVTLVIFLVGLAVKFLK